METCIAEIWAKALGSETDPDTSFFEAGGNSLLLAEVHQHLVRKLDRRFPLIELFRHTSIRAQAKYLSDDHAVLPGAAGAGRSRALLRRGGGRKNR
jgi:acyl carrier protein